ncbi:MAG TPA: FRG domain-containing protein [Pyrinomonadaceae bacterium]|jgi:hypothetical protein
MPKPVEHFIKSLTQFSERIEEALGSTRSLYPSDPTAVNWYRGTGMSEQWKLAPSLYRHPTIKDVDELLKLERKLLASFRRKAILYQPTNLSLTHTNTGASADYEFLFFMQHYNVPTRLLDWTENPFIALYFALTSAPYNRATHGYDEGASVWILDPIAWNRKALERVTYGNEGALIFNGQYSGAYAPRTNDTPQELTGMYDNPVAMEGIANNTRMFAQKGVFTIFGRDMTPMEDHYEAKSYPKESLTKLTVAKDDIDSMLELISSIGYTDSVAYPDLHGLAMEIKRFHKF